MNAKWPVRLAVCVIAFAGLVPASGEYTIIDIDVGEQSWSYVPHAGINNRGQVVGRMPTATGESHAFLWQDGAITDLGTLGGESSRARGINDLGQVVGSAHAANGMTHAFVWENGHMSDLGTLAGLETDAFDINLLGQVVGLGSTGDGEVHAFLWEAGTMTDLGTLGGPLSAAYEISNSGQAAGWSLIDHYTDRAVCWEGGVMTNLGTLPGGTFSNGFGINDLGQVVGGSWTYRDPGLYEHHGFVWEDGVMADLGTLAGYCDALAINNAGQIAGWSQSASGARHAVLWDQGVIHDLNDLIPPGCGWELEQACDINDSGWIVGLGHNPDGQYHLFLLVPEPTGLLLLALGGLALLRRKRAA